MADKQVTVKVATDVDAGEVEALETKIRQLKKQQIQTKLNIDSAKLDDTTKKLELAEKKLAGLEAVPAHLNIEIDDAEIEKARKEVEQLRNEQLNLNVQVENDKLDALKADIDAVDGKSIDVDVDVDEGAAQMAMQNLTEGFNNVKQGLSGIKEEMGGILESAGKQETNFAFLQQAVGDADTAKQKMNDINSVVQALPGDDTVLQGLLGQAVAKDASLTTDELTKMGGAAADYFSAMENFGKSSTEAFQDMNNYLLTGQTAEIERSPILANHIDKLKEANSIQERSALLQQALNEEHWGGISQQDTYNNKLQTFQGMIERGKYSLGGMFQEGAKGAMDFVMQLDASTNGLVGMAFAAADFASPLTDMVMGLGQIGMGLDGLRKGSKILKDLELADKAAAAAQWLLNAAMDANPIVLVVIAIAALVAGLIWAYYNVGWFREMVDGAFASLSQLAQLIWGAISGAIQWLMNLFTNFTNQLGLNTNDWIQALLGFILFIPTLPLQIGIALANALANALGFKGNFVQTLWNAAVEAVNKFADAIRGIGEAIQNCLNWAYEIFMSHPIVKAAVWLGQAIANGFSALGLGQSSPGKIVHAMENELDWTQEAIEKSKLSSSAATLGSNISSSFNPSLNTGSGGNGGAGNITLNIEIGSIDDEKRIRQLVDAVRRELNWNNRTAGRTV